MHTDADTRTIGHSATVARSLSTAELGDQYRRRTIADAIHALPDTERTAAWRRHVEAASIADVGRALRLDTDRVVAVLTTGHRRLVAAVPWLSGDLRCSEARASLLAGTDRADDLQHVRSCAACRAADLIGLQSALADPAAWDGTWSSELRLAAATPARRAFAVAGLIGSLLVIAAVVVSLAGRSAPDEEAGASPVAEATLDGGDLAPGVTADVTAFADPAGVRIVLRAPDLADPPAGSYYQAWVKRGDGLLAIGTFSRGGEVVLWSGVALRTGDLVTVTLEPDDGDPASSGVRVLAGEVVATP